MIPKGFKKGYVPVTHEKYMNCDWLSCVAGCGIAGNGVCFLDGHWWWNRCPEYKPDSMMKGDGKNNNKAIADHLNKGE